MNTSWWQRIRTGTLVTAFAVTAFYLLAGAAAMHIVAHADRTSEAEQALALLDSAEEKTDTLLKSMLEELSLGLYSGATQKAKIRAALEARRAAHRRSARMGALTLVALSIAFLGAHLVTARQAPHAVPRALLTHLLGVSGLFLAIGLVAPILTVSVEREIAVLGRVVLQYDSKGVLSTVGALVQSGNSGVAVLLALFSVVAPSLKTAAALATIMVRRESFVRVGIGFVELIGRWSMTDVFVVAILLAFLATRSGELTQAEIGPGFYFFAGYGLLSLLAGHQLLKHRERLALVK